MYLHLHRDQLPCPLLLPWVSIQHTQGGIQAAQGALGCPSPLAGPFQKVLPDLSVSAHEHCVGLVHTEMYDTEQRRAGDPLGITIKCNVGVTVMHRSAAELEHSVTGDSKIWDLSSFGIISSLSKLT